MISIISTFLSLFVFSGKKKQLWRLWMFHCTRQGAVLSLFPQKTLFFYLYSQNRLFPNKNNVHCIKIYIHEPFFWQLLSESLCSFGDSVMPLSFNATFSREWEKKRIWKQTFLSLSWLWIVLMITIDPPPERVKIHAGVKKKKNLIGSNALCNFHRTPVVRFSTSSPTLLKEYSIICLRSLM